MHINEGVGRPGGKRGREVKGKKGTGEERGMGKGRKGTGEERGMGKGSQEGREER